MRWRGIASWFSSLLLLSLHSSCSLIDEDLSDCGQALVVDYDLQLVTNISTELQTQLALQADVQLATALHAHLSGIFTDHAHDVDLSFYDVQGDSVRLHHETHVMDANQQSYTLYVPRRQYMHTAVANIEGNGVAVLEGDELCHAARLSQWQADTVPSQQTGLFTARQMMQMVEGIDQTFNVHLYMANCAAALVLDTSAVALQGLKVVSTGFASRFNIADSTYVFDRVPPVVTANRVDAANSGEVAFCTVSFPSREPDADEPATTRNVVETTEPFVSVNADEALWAFHVIVTLPDGTVTRSVLSVRKPLRAGQMKVIRARMTGTGGIETDDNTVAVSVMLNWKEGGHYEPVL